MMKRHILAMIIPALLIAGAANAAEIYNKDGNKLDLYGKVDARHVFSDDESQDGDGTYARLGFKGETQIASELTGFGQWEYNIKANNAESMGSSSNATRLGFAGLKFADYGSLDYGRNYGVIYDVEAWTDMLPVFGGDTYTNTDNFMTSRANNLLTYRNSNFFGLVEGWQFALQYQGKNDNATESNNGRAVKGQNGDGFGLSTSYDFGMGISAGAAYSSSDRTNEQSSLAVTGNDGAKAEAWTTGLKYDANNIYLAAMYAETRNMTWVGGSDVSPTCSTSCGGVIDKTQNYEIVAQYQFDFGLRPSLAYLQSKAKGDNVSKSVVKYVDVGATYAFNKNMSTYVDYKINLLKDTDFIKDTGINTDDVLGVGVIYQF